MCGKTQISTNGHMNE